MVGGTFSLTQNKNEDGEGIHSFKKKLFFKTPKHVALQALVKDGQILTAPFP